MTFDSAVPMFDDLPLTKILLPVLESRGVELWLLRLDQTHPYISGNKWFKLKYNLQAALENGYQSVLSFGGAYSNHIHALAWAAQDVGINSIGVIRGEPEYADNPTLSDARKWGMQLQFVNRRDYRLRSEPEFLEGLKHSVPDEMQPVLIIPEGGSNALAVKGCREILSNQIIKKIRPDQIVLPCGTGGTLSGVALSCPAVKVLGIPVLKNAEFLYDDIRALIKSVGEPDPGNWQLDMEGHFGGYAKTSPELLEFMRSVEDQCGVLLDQVYTAKMLFRIMQLIEEGCIPGGSKILALHTGGLQGRRSVYGPKN